MRRFLQTMVLIAVIAMSTSLAMAQTFTYPVKGKQGFSLSEKTRDGLHVSYNLGQFTLSPLNYRGESMSEISISGMVLPNNEGCPNLPVESRLLAVPQGANARLNVVNVESEIVRNVDIAPALRIQAENEEPEFNYVKNREVYSKNAFYPEQPFTIERTSIRGVDVVAVSVSPFQYNPVTKELKVYTNIELSVNYEGGNGHFGDDRLRSPYWDPILAAELMNYDQLPVIDYAARMQQWLRDEADGAEYLIITPNNDGWAEYANQLKDYRTRQGILTKVYRLDELPASTTDEMKAWFHNAYNTWTIPPVAILLFGDHNSNMAEGIPAEYTYHSSTYGNCITDNGYADVTGDNLPDIVFSRLVAANATEAQMMVSKQIEYEYSNPNMDASTYDHPITALGWQTVRWFQICSEVVGGYWRNQGKHPVRINEIYDGTPGDIWSSNQNTATVVEYFGPNGQGYIPATPSELGGWTGGTGTQVVNAVNSGSMLLQHRDHGYYQGWGEPDFNNSYVNQMNNVGKMTFVNTINCQTGAFDYSSNCLIEAFMRRTYNGQNAGAVGCIGPTQTSYSFVNDTYVWGLMDQYDPNFLPDYGPYASYEGNWQPAFGNVAGKYFLQQSSWPYNSSEKAITHKMFTAHCDAFLRLYTQVPRTMDVVHSSAVVAGYGAVTVSAPEGCTISLVKANLDGGWDIIAVATATGSSQTIEFEPQVPPTIINIVVTGQDYLRYEDTIEVVPAEGSYIVVDSYTPNATPVNQQTSLSMNFKNVGLDATTGTTSVTINSTDDRLTIIDGTGQFGALGSNQVVSLENEFSFIIAQDVPDNTKFHLNVTMTCGGDTWTGVVTITAAQAIPEYVGMSWAEMFNAGETLTLTATFKNNGHYMATNAVAHIASTSQYLNIVNETYVVGTLEANSQVECTFDVVIASNCPDTEQIPITFTLNADGGLYAEGSEILRNIIISVMANPEIGGTVAGGGKHGPGSTCTITAEANAGYVFNSWTLNGTAVSYLSTYSFTVSDDAAYVANFQSVTNGVAIGDSEGTEDHLPSYSFYSYTLSQQIYTAEEMNLGACDISSISFFNAGYYKTRNYDIYMVHTDKAAFDSGSDWITVTEEDRVYSGSVSMSKGVWTTIYFATPFAYDGTSNVALIVDDNSGSWNSNNMSCRAFSTENNQALYAYGDYTNYDPTNPTSYNGNRPMVKNQVIFGIASYDFTVTVSASPEECGTVSEGGLFYYGQQATVSATANEGYCFYYWKENGTTVSTSANYSFAVTGNRNLVAVFGLPLEITVSSNLEEGGTVTGAGVFDYGASATIIASANEGYVFYRWTLNGSPVSYLSTYTFQVTSASNYVAEFELVSNGIAIGDATSSNNYLPSYSYYCYTLSQQIYTASEINLEASDIYSISFFNTGYSKTRNYDIYMVNTNKTAFESSADWITVTENDLVFSGNVTMTTGNWTTITLTTPFSYDGTSNVALIVDDNSGTWSSGIMSCRTSETTDSQAIYVYSDGTNYDPLNPSLYNGTRLTVRNQVILRWPSTITAAASPSVGGTVSGSGSYGHGSTCTLTATPNTGYYFLNWTENGTVVSYDNTYSFTVNGDRNLVANFVEGESTCTISFDLYDSYYNGWNGNYLVVDYGNGSTEQLTLESGSSISYIREVATGSNIVLSWISGSYTYQCSFDVTFGNGVPIYHGSGLSSSFQQELNINCAVATAPRTIVAVADPEEGGSVEGAGTYESGTNITLTATPNAGYTFCYWSENGQQISANATYSFLVNADRDLVAHFSLPLSVSVTNNLAEGGTTTGAGVFNYGAYCTLTATPNEGYLFLNWSKNGEVVSCNANYSFSVTEDAEIDAVFMLLEGKHIGQGESTNAYLPSYSYYCYSLTQQIYTPDEIGAAGSITSISFYNAGNTKTRKFDIYMVHTDKASFENGTDWITVTEADRVYSGSNTVINKGYWTTFVLDTPFAYDGTSNLAIVIDDNMGSWTSSPHMSCRAYNATGSQAINVYSDGVNYDPTNPSGYNGSLWSVKNQLILGINSGQTIQLTQGWNWFSTYIEADDPVAMLDMLKAGLGNNATEIQSFNNNTEFDGEEWFGGLDDIGISNEQMYMILVDSDCTVELSGIPANPADHEIAINPGWNWIGFPCAMELNVSDALANFQAEEEDMIQISESMIEFDGEEWFGDFETLVPGQGYMYYSNSTEPKTLIISTGAKMHRAYPNSGKLPKQVKKAKPTDGN